MNKEEERSREVPFDWERVLNFSLGSECLKLLGKKIALVKGLPVSTRH